MQREVVACQDNDAVEPTLAANNIKKYIKEDKGRAHQAIITCASGSSLSSSSSSGSSPPLAPVAASVIGSSPCPPSFGSAVSPLLDETAAPSVQAPSDSEGMAV